ncbi:phosphatase PAP2 family protein [Novosphingobium sp. M1R2S20]|uniref:Phosphatase PAP2 family protein n=1 Tax=Novosphingobium rhizovicinum TaxID=3228928 RepID=A0ABV3RB81_9SPHN
MTAKIDTNAVGEAALDLDHRIHELAEPAREKPLVKVLGFLSEVGDQPQLRLLCGATIAVGIWRADVRLVGTGMRMLLAHECATLVKDMVKRRVNRRRPRSAWGKDQEKPRSGSSLDKEENSFPSGHSAGALAVACAFSAAYPPYRGTALLAAGSVAAAQVPRCAHYPSDVGAGLAIGAASGTIVTAAWHLGRRSLATMLRLLSRQ